jgi:hypothetical protein
MKRGTRKACWAADHCGPGGSDRWENIRKQRVECSKGERDMQCKPSPFRPDSLQTRSNTYISTPRSSDACALHVPSTTSGLGHVAQSR